MSWITQTKVNVRASNEENEKGEPIGQQLLVLPKGTIVKEIEINNNWLKNEHGWTKINIENTILLEKITEKMLYDDIRNIYDFVRLHNIESKYINIHMINGIMSDEIKKRDSILGQDRLCSSVFECLVKHKSNVCFNYPRVDLNLHQEQKCHICGIASETRFNYGNMYDQKTKGAYYCSEHKERVEALSYWSYLIPKPKAGLKLRFPTKILYGIPIVKKIIDSYIVNIPKLSIKNGKICVNNNGFVDKRLISVCYDGKYEDIRQDFIGELNPPLINEVEDFYNFLDSLSMKYITLLEEQQKIKSDKDQNILPQYIPDNNIIVDNITHIYTYIKKNNINIESSTYSISSNNICVLEEIINKIIPSQILNVDSEKLCNDPLECLVRHKYNKCFDFTILKEYKADYKKDKCYICSEPTMTHIGFEHHENNKMQQCYYCPVHKERVETLICWHSLINKIPTRWLYKIDSIKTAIDETIINIPFIENSKICVNNDSYINVYKETITINNDNIFIDINKNFINDKYPELMRKIDDFTNICINVYKTCEKLFERNAQYNKLRILNEQHQLISKIMNAENKRYRYLLFNKLLKLKFFQENALKNQENALKNVDKKDSVRHKKELAKYLVENEQLKKIIDSLPIIKSQIRMLEDKSPEIIIDNQKFIFKEGPYITNYRYHVHFESVKLDENGNEIPNTYLYLTAYTSISETGCWRLLKGNYMKFDNYIQSTILHFKLQKFLWSYMEYIPKTWKNDMRDYNSPYYSYFSRYESPSYCKKIIYTIDKVLNKTPDAREEHILMNKEQQMLYDEQRYIIEDTIVISKTEQDICHEIRYILSCQDNSMHNEILIENRYKKLLSNEDSEAINKKINKLELDFKDPQFRANKDANYLNFGRVYEFRKILSEFLSSIYNIISIDELISYSGTIDDLYIKKLIIHEVKTINKNNNKKINYIVGYVEFIQNKPDNASRNFFDIPREKLRYELKTGYYLLNIVDDGVKVNDCGLYNNFYNGNIGPIDINGESFREISSISRNVYMEHRDVNSKFLLPYASKVMEYMVQNKDLYIDNYKYHFKSESDRDNYEYINEQYVFIAYKNKHLFPMNKIEEKKQNMNDLYSKKYLKYKNKYINMKYNIKHNL